VNESTTRIDIRPEVNILSVLRHLNYKPWFAMAEFVDNALGSYLASPVESRAVPLVVRIDLSTEGSGRIVIADNAAGISLADFPRAFRAAQVPPDRTGLSEFGMGMKSAASWFAKRWSVRTSVAGDPVERSVTFDLDQITEMNIGSLEVEEIPADPAAHFTVVELRDLNHVPQTQTLTKIKSHLTSIYRTFLRSGVMQLRFRGELLSYEEVDALVAPRAGADGGPSVRWIKDIDFTLSDGKWVRGFAGVRAVGSTSQAGFALFRRDRLILGSHDETYRPVEIFGRSNTYTYQRLYGELSLTGFEVSHTKDGFRWDEQEEEFLRLVAEQIRSEPLNLFAQASGYRAKSIVDLIAPIELAASSVAEAVGEHFDAVLAAIADAPDPTESLPDEISFIAAPRSIRRTIEPTINGVSWVIDIEATLDSVGDDWLRVGAAEDVPTAGPAMPKSRIEVEVSLGHPFSRKFLGATNENSELIIAVASAFALALALGKLSGSKSYRILAHLNALVRDTFSKAELREQDRT